MSKYAKITKVRKYNIHKLRTTDTPCHPADRPDQPRYTNVSGGNDVRKDAKEAAQRGAGKRHVQ